MNWLYADYNSLVGLDLEDGVQTTRVVQNLPGATGTFRMDLSSSSVVTFATYGITNDVDIGILVPWNRVSMSASAVLSDANTVFLAGSVPSMSASGIGDVGLLGKYRFWNGDAGALAAQVQLSLPSGDEDDFRGLGVTRTLLSAIWSREGRFAPHANIGYEIWANSAAVSADVEVAGQFKYALGAAFVAHPRTTVVVTALGRIVGVKPGYQSIVVPGFGAMEALTPIDEALNVFSIAPGVKWNAYGNLVVSGHVLSTVVNDGVRANITPLVGIDWTF